MQAQEIRRRFIDFFVKKGHIEIKSSSLIPENDPTVLFTTAGMHPLVPFLMGEEHPSGRRLVDYQKCIRTDDIEEVGDATHCTFFEMLGNWSLGDYFKKEAIEWSYEFLTSPLEQGGLGLDPMRLRVTCFAGDSDAPRDEEAAKIWESLGFKPAGVKQAQQSNSAQMYAQQPNPGQSHIGQPQSGQPQSGQPQPEQPQSEQPQSEQPQSEQPQSEQPQSEQPQPGQSQPGQSQQTHSQQTRLIYFYEKKKNWWGPAGQTGPCGPDTEMFYDLYPNLSLFEHKPGASSDLIAKYPLEDGSGKCHPNCECGRYVEIWNDVFMQYNKHENGTYEPLKQQNVDTGMGLERVTAILQGVPSHYETELFIPVKDKILNLMKKSFINSDDECNVSIRIIADHLRAATFILGDPMGVTPSNTDQGYILRRLIRRAIRHGKKIGIQEHFTSELGEIFIQIYAEAYPELERKKMRILEELQREEKKFQKTLEQGLREMHKTWNSEVLKAEQITEGDKAFFMYETYGFPLEMIEEELQKMGYQIERKIFRQKFQESLRKHQQKSRAGSEQKFHGGLADHSEECRKLHTATHLLHQSLKNILGQQVEQKGSNITAERMRFDFNYSQKLTPEQIRALEDMVNAQIQRQLPVSYEIIPVEEAKKQGAIGLFEDKYADKVKVYKMGDFSFEICGGPHADNTADLKHFKITREEACSAGIRRIKAVIGDAALAPGKK